MQYRHDQMRPIPQIPSMPNQNKQPSMPNQYQQSSMPNQNQSVSINLHNYLSIDENIKQIQENKFPSFQNPSERPQQRLDSRFQQEFEFIDNLNHPTIKIKQNFQMDGEIIFSSQLSFFRIFERQHQQEKFQDVSKYERCIDMINRQSLDLEQTLNLFNFKKKIGKGGQGSVYLVFQEKNSDQIPLAQKSINSIKDFKRETAIISKISTKSIPTLISVEAGTQSIFMEFCICSLHDLKPIMKGTYLSNCYFFTNLLLTLMKILNELIEQNIFHGDVKPQNIGIALRDRVPTIILLDFGGSSWNAKDYGNCYTERFCCQPILDLINMGKVLNYDEIRFAEFYSACRTIQYLMEDKIQYFQIFPPTLSQNLENKYLITAKIMRYFFDSNSYSFTKDQFESLLIEHRTILNNPIILDKKEVYNKFCILKSL